MKGFCLFEVTKAQNNAEYRKKLETTNKYMWVVIVIGLITAVIAFCAEFFADIKLDDFMLGVYSGVGVGLVAAGVVMLVRNRRLLKDETKLKVARLKVTDERNVEIASCSIKIATITLVAAIYAMFLIGGFFYPIVSKFMVLLLLVFFLTYYIAYSALNKRM